ncbi:MAG: hypothetical protein QM813_27200 [Verrucomicrobiota bacterium]
MFRSLTKPGPDPDSGSGNQQGREPLRRARISSSKLDEKAKDFLVEKGFDPQYGARPMRRAVERYLEDPLAEEILHGHLHEGEPIQVSSRQGKADFQSKCAGRRSGRGFVELGRTLPSFKRQPFVAGVFCFHRTLYGLRPFWQGYASDHLLP